LQRVLLLLGWPSEEVADDPSGRLQHQEEHPKQEGADLADHHLAISRKEQERRAVSQIEMKKSSASKNRKIKAKLSSQEQETVGAQLPRTGTVSCRALGEGVQAPS